ncbi:hypothetical protein AB0O01_25175 [Streptomyces sp. NPDC093252]|uniref:hypothetical protein n=1 Tax=Streptomyces sp. NPDC093252 TaxID=3154980 RepID=UPI003441708B
MTGPTGGAPDEDRMSSECAVAQRPEYADGHDRCRLLEDIPMPHSGGKVTLVPRCTCPCHDRTGEGAR